jgi:predicted kinase
MLVVFSGLPGVGKTTLAKQLARRLNMIYLRIDTIEQAMKDSGIDVTYDEGYRIAFSVTKENLLLGQTVVADSTNPVHESRDAWWHIAKQTGSKCLDVQVICSDEDEHRSRVEARQSDIPNLIQPTWQSVIQRDYDNWEEGVSDYPLLTIDTAGLTERQAFDKLLLQIRKANIVART